MHNFKIDKNSEKFNLCMKRQNYQSSWDFW
jgi:hypothetical protein